MLACARIGAVHVVLFGGFSAEGIAERLVDSGAVAVITANMAWRGNKPVAYKQSMDEALRKAGGNSGVHSMLVVRTSEEAVPMLPGRDYDFHDFVDNFEADFVPAVMRAEDPLFMLYTSGSTGKPKAVVHATGGYMVWAAYTMGMVYTHQPGDVLWCTADVAWITGHTSVVYGPLANGGTTMISDSLPTHPRPGRWFELIDEYKVSMLFTAPTAVRAMMAEGDAVVNRYNLGSLRLLGVAGEPISPMRGCGTMMWWVKNAAPWPIRGGRRKPQALCLAPYPVCIRSSPVRPPCPCRGWKWPYSTRRVKWSRVLRKVLCALRAHGPVRRAPYGVTMPASARRILPLHRACILQAMAQNGMRMGITG